MSGNDDSGGGLDERYVSACDVVRSPARVDILLALAERASAPPEDKELSFSALHDAVDIDDSGQFNYHLDKLRGHLVAATDDGYRLSPRGQAVVGAILSGSFAETEDRGPERLEGACPHCEAPINATYEAGQIAVTCENDHALFTTTIPHEVAADTSLADALAEIRAQCRYEFQIVMEGVCTYCYGDVEWTVDTDDDLPDPVLYDGRCTRCGVGFTMPPHYALLFDPAVVAFFYDHGVDVRDIVAWEVGDWTAEETVVELDPVRVRVTYAVDDARLTVTADGEASVLEAERID